MSATNYIRISGTEFNRLMNVSPKFSYVRHGQPTVILGYASKTLHRNVPAIQRITEATRLNRLIPSLLEHSEPVVFTESSVDQIIHRPMPVEIAVKNPYIAHIDQPLSLNRLHEQSIPEGFDSLIFRNEDPELKKVPGQGIVKDASLIKQVNNHRKILIPTLGAVVRHIQDGRMGILKDEPHFSPYHDKVLADVEWGLTASGRWSQKNVDFGDLEIVGGHRQLVNSAVAKGVEVPTIARQWPQFSSWAGRNNYHYRSVEEWGKPEQPYIYKKRGG